MSKLTEEKEHEGPVGEHTRAAYTLPGRLRKLFVPPKAALKERDRCGFASRDAAPPFRPCVRLVRHAPRTSTSTPPQAARSPSATRSPPASSQVPGSRSTAVSSACGSGDKPIRPGSPQTATVQSTVADSVTVTLPVHPLHGLTLPFVREIRDREGRRHLDLEHPRGWVIRLPANWTDRAVARGPLVVGGRDLRASPQALQRLSVEVALLVASTIDAARGVLTPNPASAAEDATHDADSNAVSPPGAPDLGIRERASAGPPPRPTRGAGTSDATDSVAARGERP